MKIKGFRVFVARIYIKCSGRVNPRCRNPSRSVDVPSSDFRVARTVNMKLRQIGMSNLCRARR
ncbi:hypothetical protein PsorP6_000778 [Peronosclerospora sorghi]|uniref:Uncharacterized protein n=1 Tax=Peronosclerospora sorghi TaxID=230839 RepID=A0ACC0WSH5_9STRA|nr:hypothetical protein PsorP6_000778 [Peronosclerospora sorghi]